MVPVATQHPSRKRAFASPSPTQISTGHAMLHFVRERPRTRLGRLACLQLVAQLPLPEPIGDGGANHGEKRLLVQRALQKDRARPRHQRHQALACALA